MTLLVGSIFHMTRKIVSEMTYNVSMGTLNPTIPYHTMNMTVRSEPIMLQFGDFCRPIFLHNDCLGVDFCISDALSIIQSLLFTSLLTQ